MARPPLQGYEREKSRLSSRKGGFLCELQENRYKSTDFTAALASSTRRSGKTPKPMMRAAMA